MRWSDIDLAAMATSNDVAEVQSIVLDIAARPLDDGLLFDTSASTATSIRDEDEYAGVRVGLAAQLATARLSVHVDVNVGDPIWPRPEAVALPQLLGGAIHLLGYPITMVLAEKLVTAGQRGAANTRWRDFADIYSLIGSQRLDARDVHSAIRVVAEHRGIDVRPLRRQLDGYAEAGQVRWVAWRSRQHLDDRLPAQFADVLGNVLTFADGCYTRADGGTWSPATGAWT